MIAEILAVSALMGSAFGGILPAPLITASGLSAPLVTAPAPLLAPSIGYASAVPQNVAPYASSINVVTRGASLPYSALPYSALPYSSLPYSALSALPALSPYVSSVSPLPTLGAAVF